MVILLYEIVEHFKPAEASQHRACAAAIVKNFVID